MYILIVAVLALLGVTRLYKPEQVGSQRHLRLAWWWLIVSVVVAAAGQILTIIVSDKAEMILFTNAVILGALAISLFLWHKALAGDNKQDQNQQ